MQSRVTRGAETWSNLIYRRAWVVLISILILTAIAFQGLRTLSVSTKISALMPDGAPSVQALELALEQTGSFASVQLVVESDNRETVLTLLNQAQSRFERTDWVAHSQYFEDVAILIDRQLLLLELDELLALEADLEAAYPDVMADFIGEVFGTNATVILRNREVSTALRFDENGQSVDQPLSRINEIEKNSEAGDRRYFLSEDGLTGVLIIWPKAGYDSLIDLKAIIDESNRLAEGLQEEAGPDSFIGVGGRIASQVAQFDAIMKDLRSGLISAAVLIAIFLLIGYRTLSALPLILLPLIIGIVWTLGFAAVTVGGLNLITVFLTLILFGLGIDFAIHNFSRYREERQQGETVEAAIRTMIVSTGSASLIAALTTGLAFFALIFTEFRAFTEFGLIAGSGIALIFLSMYSAQPALMVIAERLGWSVTGRKPAQRKQTKRTPLFALRTRPLILGGTSLLVVLSLIFAPQIRFEVDTKRLEAEMPERHMAATQRIQKVITMANSRAIIVADGYEELVAVDEALSELDGKSGGDSTIKSVSSVLEFIPDPDVQRERLAVIRRLNERANDLQAFDRDRFKATQRFLDIDLVNINDLPDSLRRTYLGQSRSLPEDRASSETQYLVYVDPAVNMDDATEAARFYNDVGQFTAGDRVIRAASESFVLVEMLELMKADALRAILLVGFTTSLIVYLFMRNVTATLIVLAPTLIGLLITLGIMGAFGPALSIMNMVVLPSLIGISVDNNIHIVHRFQASFPTADIQSIMSTTGRAAVLTTLTTLIGFGGMITASMLGLRSLALLAIIGFLTCLTVSWLLLPIMLDWLQAKRLSVGPSIGEPA